MPHDARIILCEYVLAMRLQPRGRRTRGFGRGVQRPAEVLTGVPQPDEAVMRKHFVIERKRLRQLYRKRWRALAVPGGEIARDLSRQPRLALRSTPYHHGIGAGRGQRRVGVVEGLDVAVDDDRDRDRLLHRAHGRPVGLSLVELA